MATHTHTHTRTHAHTQYLSALPSLESGLPCFGCGSDVVHDSNMDKDGGILERTTTAGEVDMTVT